MSPFTSIVKSWVCVYCAKRITQKVWFTLAFLGYGDEAENTALELTHNWDTSNYELGNGFGHLAIEVDDVHLACDRISEKGGQIVRPAGPMKHGKTILAFVKDPDGYMIELLTAK